MAVGEGTRLSGRFELRRRLGAGGLGEVWLGRDTTLERDVAVKVLRSGDEEDLRRFRDEVRAQATLTHPAIVTLFDAGRDGDTPFLVMAYVPATPLSQLLRHGPSSAERVRGWGRQVADALAYAHERSIVHRDVKPANVLIDTDDGAYLTDFGIARLDDSTRATRTGTVVGTAAYMAPEQVRDEPVTAAADVYSLGLVLLEALTGRTEYPGPVLEAATARLQRAPAVPDELPAPWPQLLARMFAAEPTSRPTAAQVTGVLSTAGADATERLAAPASAAPAEETASATTRQAAEAGTRRLGDAATRRQAAPATPQRRRPRAQRQRPAARRRRSRRPSGWSVATIVVVALLIGGGILLLGQVGDEPTPAPTAPTPEPPESLDEALNRLERTIQP